jgi:uncharacterized membrane protein YphA (DoxX/SURF4 family)
MTSLNVSLSRPLIAFAIRVIIGSLLILSGGAKLSTPESSYQFIGQFGINGSLQLVVVLGTVILEFTLGINSIIGIMVHQSLKVIMCLFSLFTCLLLFSFVRGSSAHCGCFGEYFQDEVGVLSILRNIFVIVCALYADRQDVGIFEVSWFFRDH